MASGCCVATVRTVDRNWTLPRPFDRTCLLSGEQVWIDGRWHVVADCLDGRRLFDERTKAQTQFVSWAERDAAQKGRE